MEIWPETLPQRFRRGSYQTKLANNTLKTPMEKGKPKRRRISTTGVRPHSGAMRMSTAQWNTLMDFYENIVKEAEPFLFPDPAGAGTIPVCFSEEPEMSDDLPGRWMVSLKLEE